MSDTRNPIDVHAGHRLRIRRLLRGMSQTELAEAVGLTFQQVQKYEKGANRMGASRLQQFATKLGVEPAYFFEGAPTANAEAASERDAGLERVVESLSSAEGIVLNRDFARITDPKVRRRIVDLVSTLAGSVAQAEGPAPAAVAA